MKIKFAISSFLILLLFVGFTIAQNNIDPVPSSDTNLNQEDEFHNLPFHSQETLQHALGLSLGSVRVYTKDHGFSYGGYGEFLYQWYSHTADWHVTNLHPEFEVLPTNKDQELSLLRGVLFLGYRFSDRLIFNSEIRGDRDLYERGVATFPEFYLTTKAESHASLDQAYVDYVVNRSLTLRGGVLLIPMGLINEFHQPNEYLGTRPGFGDIFTIPDTWHALGFGIAGRYWDIDYRAYIVNGLNAAQFTQFGWRGGREMNWDTISHPSLVVRADYEPFVGGFIGGSYYAGNSGIYGLDQSNSEKFHTTMKEFHGELKWHGAFVRAQYAKGLVQNSTDLNAILATTGLNGIGKRVVGGYVEGGWNIWWHRENGQMLMPYMRGEASNPQDALPEASIDLGLIKNHFLDFIIWTYGVEWRPFSAFSIKPEYVAIHDQNQIFWKEFHLDLSYAF